MARPEKKRHTRCRPASFYFKPRGIPLSDLEEIELAKDELESIRLADLNGLFQEDAAARMNISRATFGRIIMKAHQKIAEAIINGKAIKIQENYPQLLNEFKKNTCSNCGNRYSNQNKKNYCKKCLTIIKE